MEETLLKVVDQSGILALALVVFWFGGQKLDALTKKVDCLCQLIGISLTESGHGAEVAKILGGGASASLNGDKPSTRSS